MAESLTLDFAPPPREDGSRPLADRMRPEAFDEVVGQDHLLKGNGPLAKLAAGESAAVPSIIFWGAPGCGKTTLARLIAQAMDARFVAVSAITQATADLRAIFKEAEADKQAGRQTVLLVDEIHRFNRAQQDLFLPYVENGTITLIGATTENPSFECNAALLSRCKVLVIQRLDNAAMQQLLARAEAFLDQKLPIDDEGREWLAQAADGDGRYLLNMAEQLFALESNDTLDNTLLPEVLQARMPVYDKGQDGHYNLISALHKSLRGSDPDASLYWAARMMDAGEDPLYIARRLIRFASEDIGLADPHALTQALAAKEAFEVLGSPEGELAIAQAVLYLATAPKSNAAYYAFKASVKSAKAHGSLMPPKHILNAPTALMKQQGYKDGYIYDHDTPEGFSGQNYFPDDMAREQFYAPKERGFERDISKRLAYWEQLRKDKQS